MKNRAAKKNRGPQSSAQIKRGPYPPAVYHRQRRLVVSIPQPRRRGAAGKKQLTSPEAATRQAASATRTPPRASCGEIPAARPRAPQHARNSPHRAAHLSRPAVRTLLPRASRPATRPRTTTAGPAATNTREKPPPPPSYFAMPHPDPATGPPPFLPFSGPLAARPHATTATILAALVHLIAGDQRTPLSSAARARPTRRSKRNWRASGRPRAA